MKNYLIVKDGFQNVIQSERIHSNDETGQTFFWSKEKDRVTAIIPKECIVIETTDLTEYQKTLQLIIEDLRIVHNNDKERALPEFDTLDYWKEMYRMKWTNIFESLYNETL